MSWAWSTDDVEEERDAGKAKRLRQREIERTRKQLRNEMAEAKSRFKRALNRGDIDDD